MVSIHARVERATHDTMCYNYTRFVSIHARVERATFLTKRCKAYFYSFNPRTRRACDRLHFVGLRCETLFQSTHA